MFIVYIVTLYSWIDDVPFEHLEIRIQNIWQPERQETAGVVRSEKAAVSATSSPSPAAAESARVVVVGGAGPRVLSSLLWLSLSVATAAVAAIAVVTVQGPGRVWASLLPGSLTLRKSAEWICIKCAKE